MKPCSGVAGASRESSEGGAELRLKPRGRLRDLPVAPPKTCGPLVAPRFQVSCQESQLEVWVLEILSYLLVFGRRKFWFSGSREAAVRDLPLLADAGTSHSPRPPRQPQSKASLPAPTLPHPPATLRPDTDSSSGSPSGTPSAARRLPTRPQPLLETIPRSLVCISVEISREFQPQNM